MISAELIDRLTPFRSPDAPVLSLYVAIPPDPGEARGVESRINSLLKPVRELADSDDLGHNEKRSPRADLDRVQQVAGRDAELRGRAVAVFACQRQDLYEEVVLPGSAASARLAWRGASWPPTSTPSSSSSFRTTSRHPAGCATTAGGSPSRAATARCAGMPPERYPT